MKTKALLLVTLTLCVVGTASDANSTVAEEIPWQSTTYESLYEQGIKRYVDNDWHACSLFFERAIHDYQWHTKTLVSCRRTCQSEAAESPLLDANIGPTQEFYERTVRNALCLLKCRKEKFGKRESFSAPLNIDRDFEMKKPYDYLQLCYFKMGRYQEAADAAVTVLAMQPEHEVMANNLKQYIDSFSADPDLLTNLEFLPYAVEYVAGDRAHQEEDYKSSIEHMERALVLYWEALEDCRSLCEEPFDMGWFPDFVSSVANHFTFTFRCKIRCSHKLSSLYGENIPNFLASIFNYLQFAYHKQNNIIAAAEAVESYLELVPTDASMIRNKQFYLTEFQKSDRMFVPRKEIVAHAARERYERNLIDFIDTEFVFVQDAKELEVEKKEGVTIADTIKDILSSFLPTPEDKLPEQEL